MDEPIAARYDWNPVVMAEGLAVHGRQARGPANQILLRFVLVLYVLLSVFLPLWLLSRDDSSPEMKRNSMLILFITVPAWVWVAWAFHNKTLLRWNARRAFKNLPKANRYVEWTLGADQIANRTALSTTNFLWPTFIKVVEAPQGFLLYQNTNFFNFIPGHGFASEGDVRRFSELVRASAAKYVELGRCQFVGKPDPVDPDGF